MTAAATASHTPGPWKLADDDTIRSPEIVGSDLMADYRGSIVADLTPSWGVRPHARVEMEANARLIAAAPELLAALKDMEAFVAGLSRGYEGPEVESASAFVVAARAAIAKAEAT